MGRRVAESRVLAIRAEARRVRAIGGTAESAALDLDALCGRLGVDVVHDDLEGSRARVMQVSDRPRITVSNRTQDAGAIRFSIAHELGHLLLRHRVAVDGAPLVERLCRPLSDAGSDLEREANIWATELLMPAALIQHCCELPGVTMQHIRSIARACQTSALASALRFVELTPEPCALAYCELGHVRWSRRSATFSHWIPAGRAVDPTSAVADYFTSGTISEFPRLLPAPAWISRPSGQRSDPQIVEQASIVRELGAVFALLWLPPEEIERTSPAA